MMQKTIPYLHQVWKYCDFCFTDHPCICDTCLRVNWAATTLNWAATTAWQLLATLRGKQVAIIDQLEEKRDKSGLNLAPEATTVINRW